MHPYLEYVNPYLGNRLAQFKMDKEFIRADGCCLFDREGNQYLDMIASYGALPFGYNHAAIWQAIKEVESRQEPSFVQPSSLIPAGELARLLAELAPAPLKIVTFANSGAEAVEAALKLCRAKTGRRGILSARNSFHGKTLGALSATGKAMYQQDFGAPVEGFETVPYGDISGLESKLRDKPDYYAAFLFEPIQGEGGIILPPPGYLQAAQRLCSTYGVLFVADEIQTGLGRTGSLFACQAEELRPDVLLLAKALGGGIMPIGACLCSEEVYTEAFALKHSSTFAANTLACRVGLAALRLLTAHDCELLAHVKAAGDYLKAGLLSLQSKYPQLIAQVRGKGLLLGLEFNATRSNFPGSLLGIMAEQELLTPAISSYLLNVHKIRVAPTLNGANVIRIEPPLIITLEQCKLALEAISEMLEVLSTGNTAHFLSYLVKKLPEKANRPQSSSKAPLRPEIVATSGESRFAFLVHPIDIQKYVDFDNTLSAYTEEELTHLASRWNKMVRPFVISGMRVVSKTGQTAYGEFIALARTAEELLALPQAEVLSEIEEAVQLACSRGASIVGLGAYTSVATRGGQLLLESPTAITTGNSYTVVSAAEALNGAAERLGLRPGSTTTAILGASGSIGRAACILLAENTSQLILLGNPKWPAPSRRRLLKIITEVIAYLLTLSDKGKPFQPNTIGDKILKQLPAVSSLSPEELNRVAQQLAEKEEGFTISFDADRELLSADVILSATSSPHFLLTPHNLKAGALVCDISRPGNVSPDVKEQRPDVLVIDGGIIEVPGRPDLGWNFGFEPGLAYSCMAETMMLSLERHNQHTSIGADLNLPTITRLGSLAQRHGFKLAGYRSFNKPLSEEAWLKALRHREIRAASIS